MAAVVCRSRGSASVGLLVLMALLGSFFPTPLFAEQPATPASKPQPAHPDINIPRVAPITIDGNAAPWADRGFAVAVMYSPGSRRLPAAQFDAQVRMGWNEQGLVLLADVIDPDLHESENDLQLWNGDSLEVTETDTKGKYSWHATISPGVDPSHRQIRTCFDDERSVPMRRVKLSVAAAATKTGRGYILQALFPWDMLAIEPRSGSEFDLAVRVNHPDGYQIADLEWSPGLTLTHTKSPPHMRLADAPSPPVMLAANGGYPRLHRTQIWIAGTAAAVGQVAQIRIKGALLGQATLAADGRLGIAQIILPMPPIGKPFGSMTVVLDGKPAGVVAIGNADDARNDALAALRLVAQPAVFTQSVLPRTDFLIPDAAEDAIGNYTLATTYYDADYNVITSADRPGRYAAVVEVTPGHGKPFKRYLTLYRESVGFGLRPAALKAAMQLPSTFGLDAGLIRDQLTATGDFITEEMANSLSHDDDLAVFLAGLSELPAGAGDEPRRLGPQGKNIAWWYGLRKKLGDLPPYKYLVHVPKMNKADAPKKFPLILFLHGSGERGNDLDALKKHGPPQMLKEYPDWQFKDQFIIVSPLCPAGETWNPLLLRDLLDKVSTKYPVDADRVYLTGLSMGGFGTWELAEWFPERFAAIAPVCGGGDPNDVARLANIPTWVFHGGDDPTVPLASAYEMVRAMREIHARIRFTVYPECGHHSWVPAYDEPRLYQWLLMQRRGQPSQAQSETPDTRPAEE